MSSLNIFTASKADLVDTCLGSAVIPGVSISTGDTTWGTVAHEFLHRVDAVGRERDFSCPDRRAV